MNEFDLVQIIALSGWLVLAVGALASFRLNWKTSIRYAFIWACIFASVVLFIMIVD